MTKQNFTYLILSVLLYTSLPCLMADNWQEPQASIRLRIAPAVSSAHQLWVDIPNTYQNNCQGIIAYYHNRKIPASAIFFNNKTIAVEISIPESVHPKRITNINDKQLSVSIYLLPKKKSPNPIMGKNILPVNIHSLNRKLTTSPYTCIQLQKLITQNSKQFISSYSTKLTGGRFTTTKHRRQHKKQKKRNGTATISHASSRIMIAKDSQICFGCNNQNIPWFLFINGKAIASWQESTTQQENKMSNFLKLKAGFHYIDFFTIVPARKIPPALLWQEKGSKALPISTNILFSSLTPRAIVIEKHNTPPIGIAFNNPRTIILGNSGKIITTVDITTLGEASANCTLRNNNTPLPLNIRSHTFFGCLIPTIQLQNKELCLDIPAKNNLGKIYQSEAKLKLKNIPFLSQETTPLTFTIDTSLSAKLFQPIPKKLTINIQEYSAKNKLINNITVPINNLEKQKICFKPKATTQKIKLSLTINKIAIAPVKTIKLIHSKNFSKNKIQINRQNCYSKNYPTILIYEATKANHKKKNKKIKKIAIIDDFISANTPAQQNNSMQQLLYPDKLIQIIHYPLHEEKNMLPQYKKFSALNKALQQHPTLLFLCLGTYDLEQGRKPQELCRDLLFMIQACYAADTTPIIVSLTNKKTLSKTTLHNYTLLSKELAYILQTPVLDLYSLAKLQNTDLTPFYQTDSLHIPTSTLNSQGKVWIAKQLKKFIKQKLK